MAKDNENISFFEELPQPVEPAGFAFDQMVRCDECLRANPPTRVNCLYCGQALQLPAAAVALARPTLRPPESWEQGYNNILLRSRDTEPSPELLQQVAIFLRQDPQMIKQILSQKRPLPLARTATPEEASLVDRKLNELGLESVLLPDQDLRIETAPPRRLRRIELGETNSWYQIGSAEAVAVDWSEISLVVVGRLFVKQMELRERKTRKAENEILEASETMSDDAIADIYLGQREESWRISASNFDFSCLGAGKALLAGENFPRLLNLFREQARNAEINESYALVRNCLEGVWPAEKRSASGGLRLRGSRYSRAEIITTNSEPQFTRYSRLCHYLKQHSLV